MRRAAGTGRAMYFRHLSKYIFTVPELSVLRPETAHCDRVSQSKLRFPRQYGKRLQPGTDSGAWLRSPNSPPHKHQRGIKEVGVIYISSRKPAIHILRALILVCLLSYSAFATVRNVQSYGAVGDGSHDDTSAIKSAISALQSGDQLYFPCGTYKVSSALTISVPKVTVEGNSCATIKGSFSGGNLLVISGGAMSASTPLLSVAAEGSTTFQANFGAIGGVSAGDYVEVHQGGVDGNASGGGATGPTGCDISGCRGEVVKIASVSGTTATIDTSVQTVLGLHDTYNPTQNAAVVEKIMTPLDSFTIQNITLDGSSTVSQGLYYVGVVNSTASYATTQNFVDAGIEAFYGYNNSYNNITLTAAGSGGRCAFDLTEMGHITINNVTATNLNTNGFGFCINTISDSAFSNIALSKSGVPGTGRGAKWTAARYVVADNLKISNFGKGYNGLDVVYYSSHNTWNNCDIENNDTTGIDMFGNYNQYNLFNNCTLKGNTDVQFLQGKSALGLYNDSYNTITGGTIIGPHDTSNGALFIHSDNFTITNVNFPKNSAGSAHVGIWVFGTRGCFANNSFDSGAFGPGYDIYTDPNAGTENGGQGNVTPDGTTPSPLPSGSCSGTKTPPPTGLTATVR